MIYLCKYIVYGYHHKRIAEVIIALTIYVSHERHKRRLQQSQSVRARVRGAVGGLSKNDSFKVQKFRPRRLALRISFPVGALYSKHFSCRSRRRRPRVAARPLLHRRLRLRAPRRAMRSVPSTVRSLRMCGRTRPHLGIRCPSQKRARQACRARYTRTSSRRSRGRRRARSAVQTDRVCPAA